MSDVQPVAHGFPFHHQCPLCGDHFAARSDWALRQAVAMHEDLDHDMPAYGGVDPETCDHEMIDVTSPSGTLERRYCQRCGTDDAEIEEGPDDVDDRG